MALARPTNIRIVGGGSPPPPPPPPTAILTSVTLSPSTLVPGQTATAIARDQFGATLTPVWSSSTPALATVNGSGLVTAVAPGTPDIIATHNGIVVSALLTVNAPPVVPVLTTVILTPANLLVGQTATATAKDQVGQPFSPVTWSSSNQALATVSAGGTVTAIAAGTPNIRAISGPITISASLTVTAPIPPPPPPPPPNPGEIRWANLTPLGKFLMPASGAETVYAQAGVAARDVGGQLRVCVYGHTNANSPLYELAPPATLSPFTTPNGSTARGTLVKNHGAVWGSVRKTWTAAGVLEDPIANLAQGFLSFHSNGLLYFTYYNDYDALQQKNWNLAAVQLEPTVQQYGPWRVRAPITASAFAYGVQRSLYLQPDPRDGTLLTASALITNNGPQPWGPNMFGGAAWPTQATPVGFNTLDVTETKLYVDHRISSFTNGLPPGTAPTWAGWTTFRRTGTVIPNPAFETSEGLETANPALTGGFSSWQQRDRLSGFAAVGESVFFFAELTDAHTWYNNPGAGRHCDHGFTDPLGVIGPTYTSRRLGVYTYRRADMDLVVAGTLKPHEVAPVEIIDLKALGVELTPNNMPDPGNFAVTVVPSLRLIVGAANRAEGSAGNVSDRRTVVYVWRY